MISPSNRWKKMMLVIAAVGISWVLFFSPTWAQTYVSGKVFTADGRVVANAALSGEEIFTANCSVCHYIDRKDRKVGPSLLGLFKNPQLPDSGKAASENNVRRQITDGGSRMPPFKYLKEEELGALVDFLKTH